ncbi:MAG TPA: carboxypeptidase regulatory-like domain-containing protein [Planctomycetota bacterium]|nr:carboxypeptidase regulatory-like domain-containing protein [Planctomycetota bacterium]
MKSPLKLALVAVVLMGLGWLALRRPAATDESRTGVAQQTPASPTRSEESDRREAAPSIATPAPEPVRTALAEPASAPIADPPRARLHLLDEQNGESVPFLAMTLFVPGVEPEGIVSDADGFATIKPRDGLLSLSIDRESSPQDLVQSQKPPAHLKDERISFEWNGEAELDLRVPVGPTFRLEFAGLRQLDVSTLRATFTSADPRKAVDKVYGSVRAAVPSTPAGTLESGPWLRFGPLARLVSGGPPWRVYLVSEDGLWAAQADVDANVGVQSAPLSIRLEARASLGGRLLDAAGKPVADNWMQLWPPGGSFDDPLKRPLLRTTDAQGKYRFDGVAPGSYTLKTKLKGHADFAAEVELTALAESTLDVALVLPPGARSGRVTGRVRSQSGTYQGELKAAMRLRSPPALESTKVIWEDTPEGKLGRFAFEGVSEDAPVVSLFGPELYAIDPPESAATPFAASDLQFTLLDGGASPELSFAVAAADGAPRVQRFELFVETHLDSTSPRRTTLRTENGLALVRGIPGSARYRWRLRAEGFATTWGEGIAPADDRLEILVPRAGFGLEIIVQDSAGKSLDGARIQFDGAEVASTDAAGMAHAYAEQAPQKIQVVWKDWIPTARSKLQADGTWQAFQDSLLVSLEVPR